MSDDTGQPVDDPAALIGPRIRQLRKGQGLTLESLGEATGLTHAFLSQVERNVARPSLRTLGRISSALGVTIGTLVELPPADQAAPRLTRHAERRSVVPDEDGRVRVTPLTGVGNRLQAILSEGSFAAPTQIGGHPGEELVFVVSGTIAMTVDGERHELDEGDSLVFDGRLPHVYETLGDTPPRFLVLVVHHDVMPKGGPKPGDDG